MLSEEDVTNWVTWLETKHRARSATVMQYRSVSMMLIRWVRDEHPYIFDWDQITPEMLEEWMARPRRGHEPAVATVRRERVIIAALYSYLRARGAAKSDPIFDTAKPKGRTRKPRAIDDHLWSQIWSSPIPEEDRVWLGLGAFVGLRRREIVSIAPGQVDTHRGVIWGIGRKGGNEDVVEYRDMARIIGSRLPIMLPDVDGWLEMVARLASRREGERVLITLDQPATPAAARYNSLADPRLPDPAALNRQLRRILRGMGLDERLFTPHALRHTCATSLLRCGVPIEVVADCLGHSDVATTMAYSKTAGRLSEMRERLGEL